MEPLFILYVDDQERATAFWSVVLAAPPRLHAPGMTEFVLGSGAALGLMPRDGARRLLGAAIPPATTREPRAELYLRRADAAAALGRAIDAGAIPVSPLAPRDWGETVGYVLDPDGHVVAFAQAGSDATVPSKDPGEAPTGPGPLRGDAVPRPSGVSWAAFEAEAPDLARFVRERLDAHRHRFMATLRADGAPRISGTELTFDAGELWIGGLPGSRKFDDLRRDPRIAIHSGSDDPPAWAGDARVSGRAIFELDEATKAAFLAAAGGGPPGPFELVRIAIEEVATVREAPSKDHLLIDAWRPGGAVRTLERW